MAADECNIRVVARFRPLNDSEERAGSKSVVKFPADQEETVLISVCSIEFLPLILIFFPLGKSLHLRQSISS